MISPLRMRYWTNQNAVNEGMCDDVFRQLELFLQKVRTPRFPKTFAAPQYNTTTNKQ